MNILELSVSLDKVCRICFCECINLKCSSISSKLDDEESGFESIQFISDLINATGYIEVKLDDENPHLICKSCLDDAKTAFKFKIKCNNSKEILRQCLEIKETYPKKDEYECQEVDDKPKKVSVKVQKNVKKTSKSKLKKLENEHKKEKHDHLFDINKSVNDSEVDVPKMCKECNYIFKSVEAFERHSCVTSKAEDRKLCPICGKSLSNSYYRFHLRAHTSKTTFSCDLCDKVYNSSKALKFHKFKHSGEKPYLCSLCGKSFAQPTAFKYHMRFHNNIRKYSCNFCDKTFVMQAHKVMHERTHTGVKPHTCGVCGKSFTRKIELKSHAFRHKDEKPFQCLFCDKQFIRKTHLTIHEMIHSGKRPHKCYVCGKGFIQRSRMLSHVTARHSETQNKIELKSTEKEEESKIEPIKNEELIT